LADFGLRELGTGILKFARWLAWGLAGIAITIVVVIGLVLAAGQVAPGRALLVAVIEKTADLAGTPVSIARMDGGFPFAFKLIDTRVSDADGAYLKVDRISVKWSPAQLLFGTLSVEEIDVGQIDLLRLPAAPTPSTEASPEPSSAALPELPVYIDIKRLAVGQIKIAEPITGIPVAFRLATLAKLGPASQNMFARLNAERTDGKKGTADISVSFDPRTSRLIAKADIADPAGELSAKLLDIDHAQPLRLKLDGSGPLDDFHAELKVSIGDTGRITGTADIVRSGKSRKVSAELVADIVRLLPEQFQPLVAGDVPRLTLDGTIGDDGAINIGAMKVSAAAGSVLLRGTASNTALDLDLRLGVDNAEPFAGLIGTQASFTGLTVQSQITGTPDAPEVTAILSADTLSTGNARADFLEMTVNAASDRPLSGPDASFLVSLVGSISKLREADPQTQPAPDYDLNWKITGNASLSGQADIEAGRIELGKSAIVIAGTFGMDKLDGRLAVKVPDLAPLGILLDRSLSGAVTLNASLSGKPRLQELSAKIDLSGRQIRTGIKIVDSLIGDALSLTGGVARNADGSFNLDDIVLRGAKVSVQASGAATERQSDVAAKIRLADLSALDPQLTGDALAVARLTGGLKNLAAHIQLTVRNATAMNRPITGVNAVLAAKNITGDGSGTLTIDGQIDKRPLAVSSAFNWHPAGYGAVKKLRAKIGSVSASGDVAMDKNSAITGQIDFAAPNLADLSALVLMELTGRLGGSIKFAMQEGWQTVRLKVDANDISAPDLRLSKATLNATVLDPLGTPIVGGKANLSALLVGEERIDSLAVTAKGRPMSTEIVLDAVAQDTTLKTTAEVSIQPGQISATISKLAASIRKETIRLAKPAQIKVRDGTVSIDQLALQLRKGRLTVQGTAGQKLNLVIDAKNLPLAIANRFAPGLGISGNMNASANLSGTAAKPTGTYAVQIKGLTTRSLKTSGLPALSVNTKGRLAGSHTDLTANIIGGSRIKLTVTGRAPIGGNGPMNLAANGTINLAIANAFLSDTGDRLAGAAKINATIKGTPNKPVLAGKMTVSGAQFVSPSTGLSFNQINVSLRGNQDKVLIEKFSARPTKGGTINGTGAIGINPKSGFPLDIKIKMSKAVLVSSDTLSATADADVKITGKALRSPTLAGNILIRRAEIQIPDRLPGSVVTIPVEHKNAPAPIKKRQAKSKARKSGGKTPAARLDLRVNAPNKIFVRGRGLDTEMGGKLRITGSSRDPVFVGGFDMLRGKLAVLTQRLDFTNGNVSFSGDLEPDLDFQAETRAGDVTAIVRVVGPASKPEIIFSSLPDLPQDEVLSRLLFDKATKELSAIQIAQLAAEVAKLAGFIGGGPGTLDKIRQAIGVDNIETTTDDDGNTAVKVEKYISDKVSVGVKQGAKSGSTSVQVDIDVTDRIKLQSEIDARGKTRTGVAVEWDY